MSNTPDLPPASASEHVFHLSDEQLEELTDALVSALGDALRFLSEGQPTTH